MTATPKRLLRDLDKRDGHLCAVVDCERPHYAKGYCRKHWERNHKNGDPELVFLMVGATIRERLNRWSAPNGECVEWIGRRSSDGYGQIRIDGRSIVASRAAYEEAYGPIPDGLVVRHKCDNPPCIRIEHLELGTHADNQHDKVTRGRSTAGAANPAARLTARQVVEIRRRSDDGETRASLAREFGCGTSTVSRIARGVAWKSVMA